VSCCYAEQDEPSPHLQSNLRFTLILLSHLSLHLPVSSHEIWNSILKDPPLDLDSVWPPAATFSENTTLTCHNSAWIQLYRMRTNELYDFGNSLMNNDTSEISDIILQVSKSWIKLCTCHQVHCSQENYGTCAKAEVSYKKIKFSLCLIAGRSKRFFSPPKLCYKPEGRGFESQRGRYFQFTYVILPAALWPWGRLRL
jgi:hypothetical protein